MEKNDLRFLGRESAKIGKRPILRLSADPAITYVEEGQIGDLPSMKINGGLLRPLPASRRRVLNCAIIQPETLFLVCVRV